MPNKKFQCGSVPSPKDNRDYISTAIIPQDIQVPRRLMWGAFIVYK